MIPELKMCTCAATAKGTARKFTVHQLIFWQVCFRMKKNIISKYQNWSCQNEIWTRLFPSAGWSSL